MTLADLIGVAENRLKHLTRQRETAQRIGDLQQINTIDTEVSETESTLTQLRSLLVG